MEQQSETKEKKKIEKQEIKKTNLVYPLLVAIIPVIVTLLWGEIAKSVNNAQIKREKTIELISEFARTSTEYYYYSGFRATVEFLKIDLLAPTYKPPFSDVPIEIMIATQDSIERKYPTVYNLMIEGDKKFSAFQKNLLLSQLYFFENVKKEIDSLFSQNYIPIENGIYQFVSQKNGMSISETDKNEIMRFINKDFLERIVLIINLMNNECD